MWVIWLTIALKLLIGAALLYKRALLTRNVLSQKKSSQEKCSEGLLASANLASSTPVTSTLVSRKEPKTQICSELELDEEFPEVLIQLPLYNEPKHAPILLQAVAKLDWPVEKFHIQVLDDSTDQTPELISREIQQLVRSRPGLALSHIRRSSREGFKAGALNYGMQQASAPYIAVFDADFVPEPDFLKQAIPPLVAEPKAAFVQAPWGFINGAENILTRIQRRLIGVHFHYEQSGRHQRKLVFNFNGTAGVWRREAIESVGGWNFRTVTEDLYLSYLCAMQGWKQIYLDIKPVPSELPNTLASLLIQQRRWAKGNGQVLRLLGRTVMSSSTLSLHQKFDILWHLMGYLLSGLVVLWFLALPLYGESVVQWLEVTHWLEPTRLMALFSVLFLAFAFLKLFASTRLSNRLGAKGKLDRLIDVSLVFFGAPFLSLMVFPAFLEGIRYSKKPSSLYFARTPKHRKVAVVPRDLLAGSVLISGFASIGYFAQQHGLWSLTIFVSLYLVTTLSLWLPSFKSGTAAPSKKIPAWSNLNTVSSESVERMESSHATNPLSQQA